jgi:flagellar hook protein FlgE
MASETATIQSLKAVDAWIDVINANINGGVRTAFKSSRLKFAGTNADVARAGSSSNLPLQFPEAGLTTANTIIDFSQGAITASTENSHLAVQGDGFFVLCPPSMMQADGTVGNPTVNFGKLLLTRDGEFRTNQNGLLVNSAGYFVISVAFDAPGVLGLSSWNPGLWCGLRGVYNNMDVGPTNGAGPFRAVRLTDYVANTYTAGMLLADGASTLPAFVTGRGPISSLMRLSGGMQQLQYSTFGSTVLDFGLHMVGGGAVADPAVKLTTGTTAEATILTKSLEASNASMTQSVPELSLAQKLFSALTKVLQTKQTNVDGVLNLVR